MLSTSGPLTRKTHRDNEGDYECGRVKYCSGNTDVRLALGLTYEDNEPLNTNEKLEARDLHRWELDPASSAGYEERMKREGEYEEE
jgi:Family of unknown function (DUF6335)